ncbi:MAG: MFS transporter [Actinomycetota bacterium]|nr:MFS transporter [Actinomycetota bacterium]
METYSPGHRRNSWTVTSAAFVANFVNFGVLFSFGIFLTPIAESFETSTGPVAPIFSTAVCFYYLAGAIGGKISDTVGVRPVVATGAVFMTLGLIVSSQASELWHLYLGYAPLVGSAVGCCYPSMIGTVGRWFKHRQASAISLVLAGVGMGTFIGPIVSRILIDAWGWQSTLGVYAIFSGVLLTICTFAAVDSPKVRRDDDLGLRKILRSKRFLVLYGALALGGSGFYAPLAFYNDHAVSEGVSGSAAATLVGVIGASSVVARLVISALNDRFVPMHQYRFGQLLLVGCLLVWFLAGDSYVLFLVSALLHGVSWAVWFTAAPNVLATWFGVADLGGSIGTFYTALGFGALAGPAILGFVIDSSGYEVAIAIVICSSVIAWLFCFIPDRLKE